MNDVYRLRLLEDVLLRASIEEPNQLGQLANDIESLCSSIDGCSDSFFASFSSLWNALEFFADRSVQERTAIRRDEHSELTRLVGSLLEQTALELKRQTE